MSSDKATPSSLKNHHAKKGNYGDSAYIRHLPEGDANQDMIEASGTPITIKVVLPDEMELKVYVFTDGIHEQFLAHIMKIVSLIDEILHILTS